MPDLYKNFAELSSARVKGRDYEVEYVDRETDLLIMAPHGGGIEPCTT